MEIKGEFMKLYLIESENNKDLYKFLIEKYVIVNKNELKQANVIVVNKVYNIKDGLDIVDFALNNGIEIICLKNNFAKEHYLCNFLIQNGACYI